jgi:hypothetical protein
VKPIKAQENPAAAPASETDPTIAYDRIARTIRRTIALARHIADNPAGQPQAPKINRAAARQKLIRGVEDAIHLKQRQRPKIDAEALYAELRTRAAAPPGRKPSDPPPAGPPDTHAASGA